MNKEAREIIELILEEDAAIKDADEKGEWWQNETVLNKIQTIINTACNESYDRGFGEASIPEGM
jgi:hypothetical protein